MIKIVKFSVPMEVIDDMWDPDRETLARAAEWGMRGDHLVSEPICNLSDKWHLVVSLLSKYGHKIVDLTDGYELWATRAPADYDYTGFGTMDLGMLVKSERLVAVPKERAQYQEGRYASGLYSPRKIA